MYKWVWATVLLFPLIFAFNSNSDPLKLLSEQLRSPEAISRYLLSNISYRSDQSALDENRPAVQTISLGYGDCEDFSILAAELLEGLGYAPELYLVVDQNNAHCICVWQDYQGVAYMDNGRLVRVSEFEQIANTVFENPVYFGKYVA